MENVKDLSKVLEIANNCIGLNLIPVKSMSNEEFYNEWKEALSKIDREPNEDEYIAKGFDLSTGKPIISIEKIPLRIDYTKNWKSYLDQTDYDALINYGFTKDVLENWDGTIGIADRDDNILIIRTDEQSWASLAGREWHYNLTTKLLELKVMN